MFSSVTAKQKKRAPALFTGAGLNRYTAADREERTRRILADFYASSGRDWDQMMLGFEDGDDEEPIQQGREFIHGNGFISGPPGSSKSLYANNIKKQLIRQSRLEQNSPGGKPFSVVTIDFKPTTVSYHLDRLYATGDDRHTDPLPFKWFDIDPANPTFLFNPMKWQLYEQMTLQQRGSFHVKSLGFDMGRGYGKTFFTGMSSSQFHRFVHDCDPRSFHDLAPFAYMPFDDVVERLCIERRDFEAMRQCTVLVGEIARNLAILPSERNPLGVSNEILDNSIDFADVLTKPQVVYFRLNAVEDSIGPLPVGVYAIEQAIQAARRIPKKDRHDIYLFIDEAHVLAEETNMKFWLTMARELGIHIVLIFQSFGSWPLEARHILLDCTRFQVFFGAHSPEQRKIIQEVSGTKIITRMSHSASWDVTGWYDPDSVPRNQEFAHPVDRRSVSHADVEVPGLELNEIIRVGYRDHLGIMCINRKVPGSYRPLPLGGRAFVFKKTYPVDKEIHDWLEQKPLDEQVGTFVPKSIPELRNAAESLQKEFAAKNKQQRQSRKKKRQYNGNGKPNGKPRKEAQETSSDATAARIYREQLLRAQQEEER